MNNSYPYILTIITGVMLSMTAPIMTAQAQVAKGIPSNASEEKINRCINIKNDPERLRCFETIAENSVFGDAITPLDPMEIIKKEAMERGEDVDLTIKKPQSLKKPEVSTPKKPKSEKPTAPKPKVAPAKKPEKSTAEKPTVKKPTALDALKTAEEKQAPKKQNNAEQDEKVSKEEKSNWTAGVGKHPTTNLPVHFLYNYALETITTPDGKDSKPYLMLRCHNKSITAFVYWPHIYMGKKPVKTAYIIDKDPPVIDNWRTSADGQSTGYFSRTTAVDFIQPLYSKFHLEIATRPMNKGGAITANFDISGLKIAIHPLTKSCDYLLEE